MTSELNELLQEGITRSGQLTDTADEAMDAIDAMVKNAEGLTQRVREEGTEACQHLREVVTRLEQASGELEGVRGKAEGALDGLAGKAADLKAEVGDLLERARRNLTDLDAQKDRLGASVDLQMVEAQSAFTELAHKTQELEAEAARHLDQAGAAIAAFRSGIEAARAEIAEKRHAWATALEGLEAHAREQSDGWTAALQGLLARQTAAMVATANATVARHNQGMRHVKQRFVEQAPQELASALEPVRIAVSTLKESAATRQQGLSSRARELGEAAADALSVIPAIRGNLTSTARLG